MSDRPDPRTPSEPELELASDLARQIAGRAADDGYRERVWIHAAARLIELLLSGCAVELDLAEARSTSNASRWRPDYPGSKRR